MSIKPKEPEQEPVGEAYLCDRCHTPFDGAFQCPSCGHGTATKESVYTTPPQFKPLMFPTMLRKMWSGGEVQQWLDENYNNGIKGDA